MKGRDILGCLAYKYNGDWDLIYETIKDKKKISDESIDEFNKANKDNFITIIDENYPDSFKNLRHPPFVLFYKGNIDLISNNLFNNCLSVVGSRNYSTYGKNAIYNLISDLEKNIIVVSGLAKGIDTFAHLAAIESNKKTIAVLANGINITYPKENESLAQKILDNDGLIISEYPLSVIPTKESFLVRNRLVAALGKALLVGEAHYRSGTSVTVGHVLSMGKDVGCIPYHCDEKSACNKLIKDGAYLIESSEDVYNLMDYKTKNI